LLIQFFPEFDCFVLFNRAVDALNIVYENQALEVLGGHAQVAAELHQLLPVRFPQEETVAVAVELGPVEIVRLSLEHHFEQTDNLSRRYLDRVVNLAINPSRRGLAEPERFHGSKVERLPPGGLLGIDIWLLDALLAQEEVVVVSNLGLALGYKYDLAYFLFLLLYNLPAGDELGLQELQHHRLELQHVLVDFVVVRIFELEGQLIAQASRSHLLVHGLHLAVLLLVQVLQLLEVAPVLLQELGVQEVGADAPLHVHWQLCE